MSIDALSRIKIRQFESTFQAREYRDFLGISTYRLYDEYFIEKRGIKKRFFTDQVTLWYDSKTDEIKVTIDSNPEQIFTIVGDHPGVCNGLHRYSFLNKQSGVSIYIGFMS